MEKNQAKGAYGYSWINIVETKADNELAVSLPVYFTSVKNENVF